MILITLKSPSVSSNPDLKDRSDEKYRSILLIIKKLEVKKFKYLQNCDFLVSCERNPFKIIEDITAISTHELKIIENDILESLSVLSESQIAKFSLIYKHLQYQIDLTKEQIKLVLGLHSLFLNMKDPIIAKEKNRLAGTQKIADNEYIYKYMIVQFLSEIKEGQVIKDFFANPEFTVNPIESNDYKKEKRILYEKLLKRSKYTIENDLMNQENIKIFSTEKIGTVNSFFKW